MNNIDINKNEIFLDVGNFEKPKPKEDVRKSRTNYYESIYNSNEITTAIFVLGYNRVEKTKECVESILKYTSDIKYELILIDNDSADDTYEYFKSVPYVHKKIVKMSRNTGSAFVGQLYTSLFRGKYYVMVTNDVVVTRNWLSNMIKCMESDDSIGFVVPVSSNVSNRQQVNLSFSNLDEMQREAEKFNISDPLKWEERMRLINIVSLVKKEVFDLVGFGDVGFFHDFGEDDYSLRVRRAGYKLVLCADTFIHHNHDIWNTEDKDPILYNQSLNIGRKNFKEKYFNLDAWDDILNFEIELLDLLESPQCNRPNMLAIDVRCGTPIMQFRNILRKNNILNSSCFAFTTNAKYYNDLLYVTNGNIVCDRIDYLLDYYTKDSFDYIILGEVINNFSKPIQLLEKLLNITKPGGQLLIKLYNIFDYKMFLHVAGQEQNVDSNMPVVISIQSILSCLQIMNVHDVKLSCVPYNLDNNSIKFLSEKIKVINITNSVDEVVGSHDTKEYLLSIIK